MGAELLISNVFFFTVPEEDKPKLLQRFADAAVNTAKFIYQNSYIFTNMTMMVSEKYKM
jgi:hypothetical protein